MRVSYHCSRIILSRSIVCFGVATKSVSYPRNLIVKIGSGAWSSSISHSSASLEKKEAVRYHVHSQAAASQTSLRELQHARNRIVARAPSLAVWWLRRVRFPHGGVHVNPVTRWARRSGGEGCHQFGQVRQRTVSTLGALHWDLQRLS